MSANNRGKNGNSRASSSSSSSAQPPAANAAIAGSREASLASLAENNETSSSPAKLTASQVGKKRKAEDEKNLNVLVVVLPDAAGDDCFLGALIAGCTYEIRDALKLMTSEETRINNYLMQTVTNCQKLKFMSDALMVQLGRSVPVEARTFLRAVEANGKNAWLAFCPPPPPSAEDDHAAAVVCSVSMEEYVNRLKMALETGSPLRYEHVHIREYYVNLAELQYLGEMHASVDASFRRRI